MLNVCDKTFDCIQKNHDVYRGKYYIQKIWEERAHNEDS